MSQPQSLPMAQQTIGTNHPPAVVQNQPLQLTTPTVAPPVPILAPQAVPKATPIVNTVPVAPQPLPLQQVIPAITAQPLPTVTTALPKILTNATDQSQASPLPSTPVEKVDKQPTAISTPIVIGGSVLHQESVAGSLLKAVSAGLVINGLWFWILTALTLYLIELGNQAATGFSETGITGQFLAAYPLAGLVAGGYAVAAIVSFLAAIKNSTAAKGAWNLAVSAGLLSLLAAGAASMTSQMALQNGSVYLRAAIERYYPGLPYPLLWQIAGLGGLLGLGLTPLTLIAKKDYRADANNLKSRYWLVYALAGTGTLCMVAAYLVYQGVAAFDKSHGLTELDAVVSYHVYQAPKAPGARTPKTRFGINMDKSSLMVGRDDFVEVIYDYPLPKRVGLKAESERTIRQIQVGQPFDLQTFSSSLLSGAEVVPAQVTTADQQRAYIIQSSSGRPLNALAMLTPDSVLVLLSSVTADTSELISMAESLK